ncbi:MAG: hypothetical protein WC029_02795 [Sulfuricella sp.]
MQRRQCLKYLATGFGLAVSGQSGGALREASAPSPLTGEGWGEGEKSMRPPSPQPSPARGEGVLGAIPKSLWVWRTPLSEADPVVALLRQFNFRSVFYSIPPGERAQLFAGGKKQSAAIHACRAAGIAFYAVAGDPGWSRRGWQIPGAVAELLDFQQRSQLFDGLCLDIEPHTLPEWKTGAREQLIHGYLDMLGNIRQASQSMKLPLIAAVVPFHANIAAPDEAGKSMLESAAGKLDAVVMMAYRRAPGASLRIAAKALGQLDALKKPWWFGVTTHRGASEAISHAGATFGQFSAALLELDARLETHAPLYRGIAINDYPSLPAILTRR